MGALNENVSENEMEKMALEQNAEGFTYHLDLKYGKILAGSYRMDCQSPSNESWPLYLKVKKEIK
jgi:hypothetical protein